MATELTLDAALRDAVHEQPEIRNRAIRNLAPALLERINERPPVAWSRSEHPSRAAVVEVLVLGDHADPVVEQGEIAQGGEDDVAQEGGVGQAEAVVTLEVIHEIGGEALPAGPLAEDIQRHATDGNGRLTGTGRGRLAVGNHVWHD